MLVDISILHDIFGGNSYILHDISRVICYMHPLVQFNVSLSTYLSNLKMKTQIPTEIK